jgi:peptidoglycan/xylan/chitin deacetylase (PgdA/CDA1 family)
VKAGRFLVLLYHDVHAGREFDYGPIGRSATMYHVAEAAFLRHLYLIEQSGRALLRLGALRERFTEPAAVAAAPGVLLCFDDGWQGAVERAAPILAERDLPACFFVTTQLIGRPGFATSRALAGLPPALFTVGSHGVTHRMLSSLRPAEIRHELTESKATLEDLLGRPVTALSVPGGAVDGRVVALAQEAGYTEVFTSAIGLNPTKLGRWNIARIGVRRSTDDATLRRWLAFRLGRERLRADFLAVPKRLFGMRAYSRLRRALLGENAAYQHVFEP